MYVKICGLSTVESARAALNAGGRTPSAWS